MATYYDAKGKPYDSKSYNGVAGSWNQFGEFVPGAPAAPKSVQQPQQQPNPYQQALQQYYNTINSGTSNAQSIAQSQASQKANEQRNAIQAALQSAQTNRDTGLRQVETSLAGARQNVEDNRFKSWMDNQRMLARTNRVSSGMAPEQDSRLALGAQRAMAGIEGQASDQRFAIEQGYADRDRELMNQMNNISESNLYNELFAQYRAQEMQEQAQQANQLMQYIQAMRQQEMDQYSRGIDERNFNYQAGRDQIGDQRYNQQFDYQTLRDYLGDQRWQQQFDRGILESDRTFGYQQQRDSVGDQRWDQQFGYQQQRDLIGDQRWNQQFGADQSYRNAQLGLQQQQESRLTGNQSLDRLFDIWKLTGQAPEGINGVQPGTPVYDMVGSREQGSNAKVTMNDVRQEFLQQAKTYQQNGGSVDSFIKEQILPIRDQILAQGLDINKVIDEAYYSFSNGQFPTRQKYYDYIKKQMNNDYAFEQWMKTQQLNFNDTPKGVDQKSSIKTGSNKQAAQWAPKIEQAASKHGIPPQILYNMMVAESGGNPKVKSHAGAMGLMQFMPATAKGYGIDPWNPDQSIDGAARFMKDLYKQFGDWTLAVAAYNAGPGNVKKYKGVPPFKETQNYVKKVFS